MKNKEANIQKSDALKLNSSKTSVEFNGLKFSVKQYLPIVNKIGVATACYLAAMDDVGGGHLRYNALEIAFKVMVIDAYTDLDIDGDSVNAYDLIVGSGLYGEVVSKIPRVEMEELRSVLSNHINEKEGLYKRENSIEGLIKTALGGLQNALTELDPSKLKYVSDFLNKTQTLKEDGR